MEKSAASKWLLNHKGFTLLEMLMVLTILSVMLLLIVPINKSTIDQIQAAKFIEQLEFDILMIQNLSTTADNSFSIRFYTGHYNILQGANPVFSIRKYPNGIQIDSRNHDTLVFNKNGSVINPRKIEIMMGGKKYQLVFPLGKARFYLNEG